MRFNWVDLVRQFCDRSVRVKGKRSRRRIGARSVVELMESRVLLAATPTLTVVLSNSTMSEQIGGNGVPATVQRNDADTSQALTVNLSSSDTTEAVVPATVTIAAGATSANFLVLPVDDRLLDGTQTVQITASAPGFTYSSTATTSAVGLDTTFGSAGYSTTPLAWSLSSVTPDLVIQPDGAIVSFSQVPNSSTTWRLTRKLSNGANDNSFGTAGVVTTTFANTTQIAPTSLALQPDGKIVAIGIASGGTTVWDDLTVVRYNANGTQDTSFGSGGLVRLERTTHTDVNDVAILSDGSILLAGAEGNSTFLAKLTSSGSLDSSFGAGGVVLTAQPGMNFANFSTLSVQSDGAIVVAGTAVPIGSNYSTFIASRYLASGALDTSYANNGLQVIDTSPTGISSGVVKRAVLQPDGKLVITGYDSPSGTANENWAVVRLNTDGSLDTTFSGDGLTTLDFNGLSDYANDVVLQPDGRILVMGGAFVSGNGRDLGFARFLADGSLDTSFNGTGKFILPNWAGTIWEEVRAGKLNAAGQLVFLAGYSNDMRVGQLNLSTTLPARDVLNVTDYETLSVSIGPTTVAENAGPAAVTGTVFRSNTDDLSADLTVSLSSSDTTELTVPATVVIPAGQASATFPIDAIDDQIVDGTQVVTIHATAAGYISFDDTLSVTDNDANAAPVAQSQNISTNEDTSKSGAVVATDADNDPLVYSLVASATHGQVQFNSNGTFVYTPAANYFGTDTFSYKAFDGKSNSNTATVTITVNSVNDAPVAVDDHYSLNEDQVLVTSVPSQPVTNIQMTSDAGDYIGQGRTYNLSSGITASAYNNGSLVSVHYQSATNGADYWDFSFESAGTNVPLAVGTYNGAVRYPFNPEGTPGLSVTGQGRGSNTLTGFFTISAISISANGQLQSFAATFEQHSEGATPALRGTVQYSSGVGGPAGVLANDSDVDGNALSAILVNGPQHGSVTLNTNGTFTYTPAANYNGADQFTYVASDGLLTSNPATVSLTVNSVDDAPTIANQSFSLPENQQSPFSVGTVTASDANAGQSLTYAITGTTLPGAFAVDSNTGELLLVDGSNLDFETTPMVVLTVTVTDNGTPALSSSATVTINLIDVNEAPRITTTTLDVDENSTIGTVIGTVAAADPDAGQTLTYQLVSDAGGAFAINPATGELTVKDGSLLDFESTPSLDILVSVSDGSLTTTGTVTVNVRDVNEAPTLSAPVLNVDENAPDMTVVGTMVAADPDAGQSVTFSLSDESLPGAFAIDPVSGVISVLDGSLLNYEAETTASVTVTVTDNGTPSLSTSIPVTIALNDLNESPTILGQTFSVVENSQTDAAVGTVIASDVDAGQTLSYTLVDSSLPGAFAINAVTGQITVADSSLLDYEAVQSVTLHVGVSDNGTPALSAVAQVTVAITNANDAPVLANQTFSVREYLNQGLTVGDMIATDQDVGQSLTYSIVSTTLPDAFMIMPSTGRILVSNGNLLDYETVGSVTLTVRVQDNGSPSRSADAVVTVNISDVNESPMMSDQSFSVPENSAAGTVVGTVIASDVDRGQSLTYSILSSPVPGAFTINSATGQITVANGSLIDFESRTSIELGVQAIDDGSPALATVAPITINITDVNEAPVMSNRSFSIAENSSVGTAVGTITAADPDAGQSLRYSITGGNGNNAFAVDATTGAITVNNSSVLDFEGTPVFDLTLTATDNGSPALSSTAAVTVQLTNVNDAPAISNQLLSVAENSPVGTTVGTVAATDQDSGQSLRYAITNGNTNNNFAINATTGVVTVNSSASLNFEVTPVFNLTVSATDNGSPVLSSSAVVTIRLTDVNESPVLSNCSFTIAENTASGTSVGTITATDPDAGQLLQYAITGGNTNNAYAINPSTGAITVNNSAALNYEATPAFSLTVTATDNGSPALSSSATVTIQLTNVNDPPTVANQLLTIAENTAAGTVVGTFTAMDQDSGQLLRYAITGGNTNNAFAINSTTGVVTVSSSAALNFEVTPVFNLTVTVTDNGSPVLSSAATLTIQLTNVNEAPVVSPVTLSINENSANGTVIGTVVATDPDAGQACTFAITAGNTNNALAINPTTGVLTVNNSAALNFETTPTITITVTATDNGSPVKTGSAVVTVKVLNVNEAPTVTASTFSINENSANGTSVGTITATDPDAGQTRTFAITGGNTNNAFAINPSTGVLSVSNSSMLDFETTPQFTLTVTATDNGSPAKSGSATVTIRLLNVNEAPIVAPQSFAVKTKSSAGTIVGTMVASDPDAGQTWTYEIVSGNGPASKPTFAIDSRTGQITVKTASGVNSAGAITLSIRVKDSGSPSLSTTVSVTIYVNSTGTVPGA